MPTEKPQAKYRLIADHLRQEILDSTYPAGQPLPSEESLAKQVEVTRPTVRQAIAELRAAGLVEVMIGRGMFIRSPHNRPSFTRPRGVRRDPNGGYAEADGIRWTNAEEPVATRTDTPLAPGGPSPDPTGRADVHVRRAPDRGPRPPPPTPPHLPAVLGAHRHEVRGGGPSAGPRALLRTGRPGPRTPLHGVPAHPNAAPRPGQDPPPSQRRPDAPHPAGDTGDRGQATRPGGVPPPGR